jgi:hypothetical protein
MVVALWAVSHCAILLAIAVCVPMVQTIDKSLTTSPIALAGCVFAVYSTDDFVQM